MERIIAMVVDERLVTLYRPDGSKIELAQGSPRIREIVDTVLPIVSNGGVAEVDLGPGRATNPYGEFESVASGLIKFFRVAKKVVAPLLAEIMEELEREEGNEAAGATVSPMAVGAVPTSSATPAPVAEVPAPMSTAVAEIMANAEPASAEGFADRGMRDDETMVAVVGDVAIPGVEQIADQLQYSAKLGSPQGVENLIKRMAAVAGKRMHSVQDLLRFLEKADLPIADDGSIIAYKALDRREKYFVDCHTHSVPQRVGSFVVVDEKYVDKNRRNECSNGLHIARRAYLHAFGGSVWTLCKIAPEDVIVVPHNDPNKVRVCAYHILAELSPEAARKVKNNQPMTDIPEAAKLLADVIAGKHIERLEEVRINGPKGKDVVVTKLVKGKPMAKPATKNATVKHTALDDPERVGKESRVDAKQVAADHAKAVQPSARQQKARELMSVIDDSQDGTHRKSAAEQLLNLKKTAKVGWDRLGITAGQVEDIQAAAAWEPPAKPEPVREETRGETARRLFQTKDFAGLWAFKRKAKVSWEALGFNNAEENTINNKKPE
jgi:hypothetical protein